MRLLAFLMLFALPAQAQTFDNKTPCSVSNALMDRGSREAAHPMFLYVINTMEDMDAAHTNIGEPGIMAKLSDRGRINMAAAVSVHCRNILLSTVYNSISFVYRGIREMQIEMGTAE